MSAIRIRSINTTKQMKPCAYSWAYASNLHDCGDVQKNIFNDIKIMFNKLSMS